MRLIKPSGALTTTTLSYRAKRLFNLRAWTPKLLLGRLCLLFIILIAGVIVFSFIDNNKKSQTSPIARADPCSFFTLDDAKKFLGKNVVKSGVLPASQTSKDIDTKSCAYTQELRQSSQKASSQKISTAYVIVYTPKTEKGKIFNNFLFERNKPKDAQNVAGYGQKAYWDSAQGTLSVLKDNKLITLSNKTLAPPSAPTLNDTKKLANFVIVKI
jgi:hypothetical protein